MEDFPGVRVSNSFDVSQLPNVEEMVAPNVEELMIMKEMSGRAAMQPSFKNSFSMAASLKQLNKGEADVIPQASNSSQKKPPGHSLLDQRFERQQQRQM